MHDLLVEFFPYTMKSLPMLWRSTVETLQMTFWSGGISFVLGLLLGVLHRTPTVAICGEYCVYFFTGNR